MENLSVSFEDLNEVVARCGAAAAELKINSVLDVTEHVLSLSPMMGIVGAEYLAKLAEIEARHLANTDRLATEYENTAESLKNTIMAYEDADVTFGDNLAN